MLHTYFKHPQVFSGIKSEKFKSHLNSFAKQLHVTRYAREHIRNQIRAAAHFCVWADSRRIDTRLFSEEAIKSFCRHLPTCQCTGPPRGKSVQVIGWVRHFVEHLKHIGEVESIPERSYQESRSPLLVDFLVWMRDHRGVCARTLQQYERYINDLLRILGDDPGKFNAQKIRDFVQQRTKDYSRSGGTRKVFTAVRMFLRYLATEAKIPPGLVYVLPPLASWRSETLPHYLSSSAVDGLIAACDPTTKIGIRDRAIILLLARLGLRAGDVAQLRLSDISWEESAFHLSGKGRREARLPLSQEVGDGILAYIKIRPEVDSDYLFLRAFAPYKPFVSGGAVSLIVRRTFQRSGVKSPSHGSHILRYSAATEMLRQGITLHGIATVLRHRSFETTTLYAKIDVDLLRQVTQPWPEVLQ